MTQTQQFMSRAFFLQLEIARARRDYLRLKEQSENRTSHLSEAPHSGGGSKRPLEDAVIGMIDLEKRIPELEKELTQARREIETVIQTVENRTLRQLLRMRCLEYADWWMMGDQTGMTAGQARILYSHALSECGEGIGWCMKRKNREETKNEM